LIIAAFFCAVCMMFSPICRTRLLSAVVTSLLLPLPLLDVDVVPPDDVLEGVLLDVLLVPEGLPLLDDGLLDVDDDGDSDVLGLE